MCIAIYCCISSELYDGSEVMTSKQYAVSVVRSESLTAIALLADLKNSFHIPLVLWNASLPINITVDGIVITVSAGSDLQL